MRRNLQFLSGIIISILVGNYLSACQPQVGAFSSGAVDVQQTTEAVQINEVQDPPISTQLPGRPVYSPGELVDYVAQTGDTLPTLATRFNTTVEEIRQANPFIPDSATTMPPGMPMQIPIYYTPFWGSSYQILPDSLFINGPSLVDFNTSIFVSEHPGWLKSYVGYAGGANRSGAEIVDFVAVKFSVSPRLLLSILEYQSGALSNPDPSTRAKTYPLGYQARDRQGLYRQLLWGTNLLNNGYYSWRKGTLTSIERKDGRLERFDPWQNAATVSLHNFFNSQMPVDEYHRAISPEGLAQTYAQLFGDPWSNDVPHIPGSLEQPPLTLPFAPGETWAYTGGPHTGWGVGEPFAALDFAPPVVVGGCTPTSELATAIASGVIARSETGEVVLDLDGDGDERTGWNIFYLHVATEGRVPVGAQLETGDPIGYPSCEGGTSTGTHIHIARKYNGEWILAEGVLAFNLEGWTAHDGSKPYLGTLTRLSQTVIACECSNQTSFIKSEEK
ncbi:MAG: LysM peptidoglycan-binding domain-containing protein [Anaerolineales bacterium]|jgi:murein DD-endopeptidase MepM/ murein hydrolase activator NlpD